MTNYQYTKDFMSTFKQSVPLTIVTPSLKERKLRAQLILEEALELVEAMGLYPKTINGEFLIFDDVKHYSYTEENEAKLDLVLDAIVDLDVVNKGTAIAFGFSEKLLSAAEQEVFKSNISKLWKQPFDSKFRYVPTIDDKHYVAYDIFGKIRKSPEFIKPDISSIIHNEINPNCK